MEAAARYRVALEALKFLEPKDVLQRKTLISRVWRRACECDELWTEYCDSRHFSTPANSTSSLLHYKRMQNRHFFAYLTPTCLYQFDVYTEVWEKRNLDVGKNLRNDSRLEPWHSASHYSLTQLSDGSWLRTGGKTSITARFSNNKSVFRISETRVTALQDLKIPRYKHASVFYRGRCYVFGGDYRDGQKSCESLAEINGKWTEVSEMLYNHSMFTVCGWSGDIYLIGGNLENLSESYSLKRNTFTPLSISFPQSGGKVAATVSDNGQLLILGKQWIGSGKPHRVTITERYWASASTDSAPILTSHTVYQLHSDSVVKADLHTFLTRRFPIPDIKHAEKYIS